MTTSTAVSSSKETKESEKKTEIPLIIFSNSDLKTTKFEETEYSYLNLILDLYLDLRKILEIIFTDPFRQEFEENQGQQNSSENNEKKISSKKETSNNESDLKYIIPLFNFELLENSEINLIKIDVKQFAEALKNARLLQKIIEPEYFYSKVNEDSLDFLKKFEETSKVNN